MTYVALLDLGFVKAMIFVFGTEDDDRRRLTRLRQGTCGH